MIWPGASSARFSFLTQGGAHIRVSVEAIDPRGVGRAEDWSAFVLGLCQSGVMRGLAGGQAVHWHGPEFSGPLPGPAPEPGPAEAPGGAP